MMLKLRESRHRGLVLTRGPPVHRDAQVTSHEDPAPTPWLNEFVPLPGGYKTTRRDVLKLVPLAGGLGSIAVALANIKRNAAARVWLKTSAYILQLGIIVYLVQSFSYLSKALSFASPKAVLTAIFPRPQPASSAADSAAVRVAAYRRYIAALESRGAETVPEFPVGAQWLNAPPLRLSRELQGRVVLLDFWTFCCINCMHILPDLAALERKYADQPVTVVGVHSAKFDNEKDAQAVRNAVLRYDVEHPVVNDGDMSLWYALGISSWPTQVVVSPTGKLLLALPGEGRKADIDACIQAALEHYGEAGLLVPGNVPMALERDKQAAVANTPLRFPGKIAVDERGGRLFIADSSNHRVLVTDLSGTFLRQVGGNGSGLVDGPVASAAFNRPQGLAYCPDRNRLYVADTESHAVRCVDWAAGTVSTLAGNGLKGSDLVGGGRRGAQQLNSPWDIVVADGGRRLLVAMAGQHQIWELDVDTGVCAALSGTGAERNQNGATGATTAWAQPSGLALTAGGQTAFVADAESSSVRLLDTKTGGSTLVAGGDALFADNLFRFGDRDGPNAALQHPLAVACAANGDVYIADSYNHKVKKLAAGSRAITTVAGTGAPGFADGPASGALFSEPGGLVVLGSGDLLVADTNNSVIRRLATSGGGVQVSTVDLQGVPPVATRAAIGQSAEALSPGTKLVRADTLTGNAGTISVQLSLVDGFHLTVGARSTWKAVADMGDSAGRFRISNAAGEFDAASAAPTAELLYSGADGMRGVIRIQLAVYFCRDGDVCLLDNGIVEIPVQTSSIAPEAQDVQVTYRVSKQADVTKL